MGSDLESFAFGRLATPAKNRPFLKIERSCQSLHYTDNTCVMDFNMYLMHLSSVQMTNYVHGCSFMYFHFIIKADAPALLVA